MKKVSLLLVLVFAAITVSAQDSGFSTKAGRKATFARNGFFDNWFVGAGAGANMYFAKPDGDASFFDRPTLTANLQLGKWYNPYLGIRAKGTYGKIHTFANNATVMRTQKALTGEVDVMVNLMNYFGKYNEKRLYSLIPYVGIGAAYGGGYSIKSPGRATFGEQENQKSLTFNGGLINNFRITDKLSLAIELSAVILKDDFDRRIGGDWSYDLLGNASANLIYKLGSKTDFSEALLMDQGLIDDLNSQINRLRQENAKLSVPKECPKCPDPVTKVVEVNKGTGAFISNVVFFRIGSAVIDRNQEISIFNTAKYLQDNPSAKVKIVGYADKKTGTPSINEKLSEKRAKNVANALIKKYNIDSNRVTIEWKGDTEQPYAENAWNRVAIFFAE
ncbi:OmpA family protein [Dysgonomonas sp. ZJ279]|uniref:OmpA family protein n=1 Tax=Dysgonomonas sp. ZJ279 TaxID=2709796 RepID=UPI0013EAB40C|nr:OmpA family protein [Dysgonomonas sp. ZJ279]